MQQLVRSVEHLKQLAAQADEPLEVVVHGLAGLGRMTHYVQYRHSRSGRHWYIDGSSYTEQQATAMVVLQAIAASVVTVGDDEPERSGDRLAVG